MKTFNCLSNAIVNPKSRRVCAFIAIAAACGWSPISAQAQMVTGSGMQNYEQVFGVKNNQRAPDYAAVLVKSSAPGNILFPGEQPRFEFQLQNNLDSQLQTSGKVSLIGYGTRGIPGDIWKPEVWKIDEAKAIPIAVKMDAKGFQNFSVSPQVPARLGGYALIADLGTHGRQFIATFVRTFRPNPKRIQFPHQSLDDLPVDVLKRLGIQAIRHGISYKPTTDADFPRWYSEELARLKEYRDNNITVLAMYGAGAQDGPTQPLGRARPWLSPDNVLLDTKSDMAWLPSHDADFQKFSRMFARDAGWPKGPITAVSLWNEPWEGISISGWGADMLRYRDIYSAMIRGVEQARREDKVQVLTGGGDSSSNALDKLFPDTPDRFLPTFDFLSVHYQGLSSMANVKMWRNRKSPRGRVRIWDTESWVANTDDRIAAVVATNRASGYDRAMGVFGGNITSGYNYWEKSKIFGSDGKPQEINVVQTWSPAAAIGASQHFIGEHPFNRMLFQNGLPWVMVFDGETKNNKPNAEDGTLVVVGDIGEEFGADNVLFRTARGFKEEEGKEYLRQHIESLTQTLHTDTESGIENYAQDLEKQIREAYTELARRMSTHETLSGASMTIKAPNDAFGLYDFYGNRILAKNGRIVVPLDGRGFFLRGNGKTGSFAKLVKAVSASHVEGIEPLAVAAHDMTAPINTKPTLRLELTNVLNRAVKGRLDVSIRGLKLQFPTLLSFGPNETKTVIVRVVGGKVRADNSYAMTLSFDAGRDGVARHEEDMHVNAIARRTIKVDGDLSDWKDILPQTVKGGATTQTLTEAAWFPFKPFDANTPAGVASGYLAYDARNFYFAAKIADSTPEDGMVRFATRDDNAYFYPSETFQVDYEKSLFKQLNVVNASSSEERALQKPEGEGAVQAFWETSGTNRGMALDFSFKSGAQQVAFYFASPDGDTRNQKITIIDRDTNTTLDERDLGFRFGQYAVYNLSGRVRVWIRRNDWRVAQLGGFFFDAASGDALSGNAARFIKLDNDTQGKWRGVYGALGFNVIGASEKMPAEVSLDVPTLLDRKVLKWPSGVRRYSYRMDPELPAGNFPNHDNVQIAFNVLDEERKPWMTKLPGLPARFTNYKDTDYEYSLNPVAAKYGGGTEIWRAQKPGLPQKHFYPRQPKAKGEGAVTSGKLVVRRVGNTRLVEAAIPWSEMPDVKRKLDANQPIKFSFRVNDNAGGGTMELSKNRSIAKRNGSFHVDWVEHWANELEFGWQK